MRNIFKSTKGKEVSKLGKNTIEKKLSEWECNVIENEKLYGFCHTIEGDLLDKHKNEKAIIFSAGCHKDWLKRDHLKQIYSAILLRYKVIHLRVACRVMGV